MSYKFIFDTSAIDLNSIKKLQNAGLLEKCANKEFIFYITPPLSWECIGLISNKDISGEVVNLFNFILTLNSGVSFNEIDNIITAELEGLFPEEFLFSGDSLERQALIKVIEGQQLSDLEKKDIPSERKKIEDGKNKLRSFFRECRNSVKISKKNEFPDYLKSSFDGRAKLYIQEHISSKKKKDILVNYWQENKSKCPYFNKFIEGMMFLFWYAGCQKGNGIKIDKNGMEDIEHLVYLLGVDGIISEEKGFLKSACKAIFPEKDFLSVDEFLNKFFY